MEMEWLVIWKGMSLTLIKYFASQEDSWDL